MDYKLRMNDRSLPQALLLSLLCWLLLWNSTAFAAEPVGLVLRADGDAFAQVVNGLRADLDGELVLSESIVDKGTSDRDIQRAMKDAKPTIVILIGNGAINAYTRYQKDTKGPFPPAVALAALYVDRLVQKMENTTGIRYEIPAVTSLVNLRNLLRHDLKRVGVVYRSWMEGFVEQNAIYARSEKIELVGHALPNKDGDLAGKLKDGLEDLMDKKVDAFWIINDNALLNGEAFAKAWLPVLARADKPVVVGVDSLVSSRLNFGSYAIVPDHFALGLQGASMVFEIMDNDWSIEGVDLQQPLSVKKIVNVKVMDNKSIALDRAKLAEVDQVITE